MTSDPPPPRGILQTLGLHRRELRAWAMYDWANSAMVTTITAAVFPIYYVRVAAAHLEPERATQSYGLATVVGLSLIAAFAPLLGTIADYVAIKKRLLGTFMGIGVAAVAMMFFIQQGDLWLAAALFVLANVGVNGSFVFYESLLPHIAHKHEMDRVSTAAYALGYVGGGILLALQLAWIMQPALFGLPAGDDLTPAQATLPTRLAFLSVAVWWVAFSIPLFRVIPEPPVKVEADELPRENPVRVAFRRLARTFRDLRGYRPAFLMLLAFLIYNDGIGTIIRMATAYGAELGIGEGTLIGAIMMVQFVGIPFSFAFGMLAGRIGAKASVYVGLATYTVIAVLGYFMRDGSDFMVLALLVGTVQGGTQALSRSLFASMIPRHKSGEFFGFWSVFEKFAGILGPLIFTLAIAATGSSRNAILSVIVFFVVGGFILYFVDVEEGRRRARAEEEAAGATSIV
jgi:MFS transporter, UMF1 family